MQPREKHDSSESSAGLSAQHEIEIWIYIEINTKQKMCSCIEYACGFEYIDGSYKEITRSSEIDLWDM
jgi:hypothetical protein